MCLDEHFRADMCSVSTMGSMYPVLKVKDHQFHTGKSCKALGFEKCPQWRDGIEHYKPCETRQAESKAAPVEDVAEPFVMPPAGDAGPAYIALHGGVAVILADGTASVVEGVNGWVYQLTLGADGGVYGVGSASESKKVVVYRFDGAVAKKVGTFASYLISALAIDKGGVIYGADGDVVIRLENGKATRLPAHGLPTVTTLAIDDEGALVAASYNELKRFANDAWAPLGPKTSSVAILKHGTAPVLMTATSVGKKAYSTLKGGELVPAYPAMETMTPDAVIAANGLLLTREAVRGVWQTRITTVEGGTRVGTQPVKLTSGAAFDARGRAWFVESAGLSVVSVVDDDTSTKYLMGTLPALTRIGDSAQRGGLLVVGAGPSSLPPPEAPRVVETVTAKISIGKAPLANADVLLCTFAMATFRSNPCENTTSTHRGRTDEKGAISFTNIPVGNYQLAFKEGTRWTLPMSTFIGLYAPASSKELGTFRYR